jgi:hypothetical protein
MVGELTRAGVLQGAEGLRPSAEGVRLRFSAGRRTVTRGPFDGGSGLVAGFTILRARSLDDAIEWATRQADAAGDVEIDIRPVNEPWDIGLGSPPDDLSTRRYMILRKATPSSASAPTHSPAERTALARLIDEMTRSGVHVTSESMRPGRKGRRYINSHDGIAVYDGPFTETKELIGGYVLVSASSLDEADRWARQYIDAVGADEVDLLELE